MISLAAVASTTRWRGACAVALGTMLLAGCTTLPTSGPTGSEIRSQLKGDTTTPGITLV